jgi:DNA polymerase III subunit epsilon
MRERLHEYLAGRPSGATSAELLDLVFTCQGRDPEFGGRFIATLLGSDPRFRFDPEERRWRARVHDRTARALADLSFVVVDLETTGGSPGASGIIEIGAVRVVGGRLVDSFATLVDPGRSIPSFVSHLTGITHEMVVGQPSIAEALPRFLEFAGDGVLVAHNLAFDLGHLNGAHHALFGRPLEAAALCTLRLSRRLMPDQRRRSLDALAATLGISAFGRHRALPDAQITAEILCVFLERIQERGLFRLDQVLDLQQSAIDGRPFIVHVPRARLNDVPESPGVYHLLGADGRLLYVGKARRLRARMANYFTNARGHSPRVLDLIRHVYDFRITETGSELAASLLEARHIRELKPPYNRQRKHLPRVGFLKLHTRSPFPRLAVTRRLGTDRSLYVGPFRSLDAAERTLGVVARMFGLRTCAGKLAPAPEVTPCLSGQLGSCTAPCAARVDREAYGRQVQEFLALLEGDGEGTLGALAARRERLSADLRFEAAARAQRDIEVLEDLRRRRRTLSWVVTRQNFAVLLPTFSRDAALLYAVLGGRLALEARITAGADLMAAAQLVRERFARCQDLPLAREDVDGTTIIAAWLRDRGANDGILLPLDRPDAIVERLDELVITLRDLRLPAPGPLPVIDWPASP